MTDSNGYATARARILGILPVDGSAMRNHAMQQSLRDAGIDLGDEAYVEIKNALIAEGMIDKGRGRDGSIYRTTTTAPTEAVPDFELKLQSAPTELGFYADKSGSAQHKPKGSGTTRPGERARPAGNDRHEVLSYRYEDERRNNPHLGMVNTSRPGGRCGDGSRFQIEYGLPASLDGRQTGRRRQACSDADV